MGFRQKYILTKNTLTLRNCSGREKLLVREIFVPLGSFVFAPRELTNYPRSLPGAAHSLTHREPTNKKTATAAKTEYFLAVFFVFCANH